MTNSSCNFEVERVALDDLGIDAGQKLGMVIVQPDYELVPDGTVPFRISENYRVRIYKTVLLIKDGDLCHGHLTISDGL